MEGAATLSVLQRKINATNSRASEEDIGRSPRAELASRTKKKGHANT